MHHSTTAIVSKILLCSALVALGWSARAADAVNAGGEGVVGSRFTVTQRGYIQSWLKEQIPELSGELVPGAVDRFLEDLQRDTPGDYRRLLTADFPVARHRALLYRAAGAELAGVAHAALREEVARRRVHALLVEQAAGKEPGKTEAAELIAKIKLMASVYPKRLFEGRMDDDELALLLRKARDPGVATPAAPAKPKVLTAGDIVSEFARRNQEGSGWQKIQAMTIESRLKTAKGEELTVFLFRMRPDRFRMAIVVGGVTRLVTAFDGLKYWQQVPGQGPQSLTAKAAGQSRYLGEFTDPLLADRGVTYERLADGSDGGAKLYRLAVRRGDGSGYIVWIDQETFRQVGREMEDRQTTRYSDFRVVAGLTLAFREESTDAEGRRNVLTIERATVDAGLIQALFELPPVVGPAYFDLEQMSLRPPLAVTK